MNEKLKQILAATNDVHLPIQIDENETAEKRLLQKEVLESRVLADMESLDNIITITPWVKTELTKERFVDGEHSLKFTSPTNLKNWDTERGHGQGRIYDIPSAYVKIDNEDWSEWNRLSVWVYSDCPGMKSQCFRIQLHNDGDHKVPDRFDREGGHNYNLKPNCWNHIVLEIPYVARDKVIGVSFDYDMVGHEPDAVDHITWYIDKLELQKVKCDVYEGWIPAGDRISYSNSGYQSGSSKAAIASGIEAKSFKLIELDTARVVLEKEIVELEGKVGKLQVMDFSEIIAEGSYMITAGNLNTRAFRIGDDVWENSIWKVLNFFLVLRCGHEVYGKHRACHSDILIKHGDKAIVANGGWHDAGDLAQGLNNTNEATQALLCLARTLKGKDDRLYARVLEEAKWGMDYVLKMRFGDGYRASYTSCSIWTDGVIGTDDDITPEPTRSAYTNMDAAYALALGAQVFADVDVDYSRYALKIAREDFAFGEEILKEISDKKIFDGEGAQFNRGDLLDVQIHSISALAACELYKLTKEESYKELSVSHADIVVQCQQREYTNWDVPMIGFYYENRDRKLIWHHNHMSYAYLPDLAMSTLCEAFSEHEHYMLWYSALVLSGKNYAAISKYTTPYGVIPSGIYHINEAVDYPQHIVTNHPLMERDAEDIIVSGYRKLVENGFPLGSGYYLRVYPVWFSFRGNYNVILSDGKAASTIARITNNLELYNTSQRQFEWIVGKNPMAQSTMYGEGYDYVQLYAVQPGQTVGALSVGMQSNGDTDAPFWPQVNNATYKEVWVCSATKWMWGMADTCVPSTVSGYLSIDGHDPIKFTHKQSKQVFTAPVHKKTGYFELQLPAGEYLAEYGASSRRLVVISGKDYEINGELYNFSADYKVTGDKVEITVTLNGKHSLSYAVQAYNLKDIRYDNILKSDNTIGQSTVTATLINPNEPFVALVIPNGSFGDKLDVTNA